MLLSELTETLTTWKLSANRPKGHSIRDQVREELMSVET